MKQNLLLIQPGAFGDLFICAPIAKWYADRGYKVTWPVRRQFIPTIKRFPYVEPLELDEEVLDKDWLRSDVIKCLRLQYMYDKVLNLADRGPHQTAQQIGERFDECKYRLAQVPREEKQNLVWSRDVEAEQALVQKISPPAKYVVAHLYTSNRDHVKLPTIETRSVVEIREIEPFTILDWYQIIIGAQAVYCVESAVQCFIDGFSKQLDQPLYLLRREALPPGPSFTMSPLWSREFL